MKIGVISDTHIPLNAQEIPAALLESLKSVDMIMHAGDLIKLSVIDTLRSICATVKAVYGNMDSVDVKKCLPEKEIISIGKYRLGLTHGKGSPNALFDTVTDIFKNDSVDMIIFGHSHYPINEKRGKIIYFNPGSPTDNIFAPFRSYGIIEIDNKIKTSIVKI
ncbi:MAG: metallophosphoesterase family protein [Candidatus Omnitrophota bacterium]